MTDDPENTGEKQANGRLMPPKATQFKKGFDPRRNLKGVPKDAVAMRQHMRKIAAELIGSGDTEMTRLDAALRQLWTSRNPAHNKLALQVLDPKILTEAVDLTNSDGTLTPEKGLDDERFNRAISTLADALRDSISGKGTEQNSDMGSTK